MKIFEEQLTDGAEREVRSKSHHTRATSLLPSDHPLLYVDACDILLFKCNEEININTTRRTV